MLGLPWPGGLPAADTGGVVGPGQSQLSGSHAEHVLGVKRAPSLVPGRRYGPGRGTHRYEGTGSPSAMQAATEADQRSSFFAFGCRIVKAFPVVIPAALAHLVHFLNILIFFKEMCYYLIKIKSFTA